MLSAPRRDFEGHFADVYPEPNTGCWLWPGTVNSGGYGLGEYQGRQMLAHRAAFLRHKGNVPLGMHVLHTCDVPLCVNPDHLYVGTQAQNMADMSRRGRHVGSRGKRGAWKRADVKISDAQVREILIDPRPVRTIAPEYGISSSLVHLIKLRKRRTNL